MNKNIHLTPNRITKFFIVIVGLLLIANLVCVYLKFVLDWPYGFIGTFYFGRESNIPSLYSSLAILFCGILLFAIGNLAEEKKKKNHYYWRILGVIFTFLAADELLAIHEMLTSPSRAIAGEHATGLLFYAWVIPYGIAFILISVAFLRFFLRLPRRIKIEFAVAAVIFLSGAVFLEMIGGRYHYLFLATENNAESNLNLALMVTLEELMEMSGIVIFIHALTAYYIGQIDAKRMEITLAITTDATTSVEPKKYSVNEPSHLV
jgi:hypothetical protein